MPEFVIGTCGGMGRFSAGPEATAARSYSPFINWRISMMDFLLVIGGTALFVIGLAYTAACDRI